MRPFLLLILCFILIPTTFYAQKSLTGLWTGKLSNDSATSRKDESFEIALTQYKEKVYGYSRATFIVNDTLYYIVKRVKGTVNGNVCEIKDDEIISNNFPGKIDKGVKVTTTFHMNQQDSVWHLDGEWNTNKTKKFYVISGKIELKDEPDLEKSKIFPHLEELNLTKDVPFYAAKKQAAETKAIAAAPKKETAARNTSKEPIIKKEKNIKPAEPVIAKNESKKQNSKIDPKPVQTENEQTEKTQGQLGNRKQQEVAITKPVEEKKKQGAEPASIETKKQDASTVAGDTKKKTDATPVASKPAIVAAPVAAALVRERKTAPPQEVPFKSDSIQLALYDNGEVDGDTVSVLLNGDIILAKQGLRTTAIRKTIYVDPGTNEVTLVLYAENLGKYPPNTGLLVVYDGEERYQIRFSADLQQNASVVFRRKK